MLFGTIIDLAAVAVDLRRVGALLFQNGLIE